MFSRLARSAVLPHTAATLLYLFLLCTPQAWPQEVETPNVSAREILEANKETEELVEEKLESDAEGIASLSTPLNALLRLQKAVDKGDHDLIIIARLLINQLGLSLTARVLLESSDTDFIAWTVLLMGLLSLARDYQIRKLQYAGNTQYVALLKPFTTIIKVIVVTFIGLYWAKSAGYDMSTILAGLGVGSLAVALAAQKTLENVIGAVTLYTARPVSAGDFCRFGKITGTVEEIGLRSTLIRTLDRTMVVIPNSVFSSQEIENFSHRDRIRYFRHLRLQPAGSPA